MTNNVSLKESRSEQGAMLHRMQKDQTSFYAEMVGSSAWRDRLYQKVASMISSTGNSTLLGIFCNVILIFPALESSQNSATKLVTIFGSFSLSFEHFPSFLTVLLLKVYFNQTFSGFHLFLYSLSD